MATGEFHLKLPGRPSDGSSGNAAPAIVGFQGTEANPKKHFLCAAFDPATDEHITWSFRMPSDYASGGAVIGQYQTNDTGASESAVWGARLGAVTPADADTFVEHAAAAASTVISDINTTEARRVVEFSITLANLDSVVAGDRVHLIFYRDADNASDDLTSDAELIDEIVFQYTTT